MEYHIGKYLLFYITHPSTESEFPKDHARHHDGRLAAHIRWRRSDQCSWTSAGENPFGQLLSLAAKADNDISITGFALNLLSLSIYYCKIYKKTKRKQTYLCVYRYTYM